MVISRFAPAPTGFLHLGHVVNAIYVWGMTRAVGGRVLLRIEDHDGQRSRPAFERAMLDDLEWLGFVPDEPSTHAFRSGPCGGRQSHRGAIYERALAGLQERGLVYACDCSRREIAFPEMFPDSAPTGVTPASVPPGVPPASGPPGVTSAAELRYPGTCAGKGLPDGPGLGVRIRLAPSVERFDDLRHGAVEQRPFEQCGDLLARDRAGNWTYQFAATVDDAEQGVTLVVRGDDLLASTGRQMQLARLLGRLAPPAFFHHPLIMKTPAQKLSKGDGDTSVRDLRAAGWTAERTIGQAAAAVGLIDVARPIRAEEVVSVIPARVVAALRRLAFASVSPDGTHPA